MSSDDRHWAVRREEDDAVARAFLERDRAWATYLLADLEPPLRQYAHFYLARRDGRDEALLLVYQPPEFTALGAMGEPAGVAAALAHVALPSATGFSIPLAHRTAFETHYEVAAWARMQRMVLPPDGLRVPPDLPPAERLGPADRDAIAPLLDSREHIGYLTADMLATGEYFGVRRAGELVAVAGTHVVAPVSGVAAIGNVYTAPEARRQGFGLATTAAVVQALLARGIEAIVLNVNVENVAARRVYEQLGFRVAVEYWETDHAVRRVEAG